MDAELLRQTSGFDYIFAYVWALVLGLLIFLWPIQPAERRAVAYAWGAKVLVVLVFMLPYEEHYGLDSYVYFLTGELAPPPLSEMQFGEGSDIMKFLSGVHLSVLPTSFHAEKITWAYIGLIGIFQFYVVTTRIWPKLGLRGFYTLAFFPSILFWTSIFSKDPIVFLGIGLFVRGVLTWYQEGTPWPIAYAALGALLAASFRLWLGPILVTPLLVFVFLRVRSIVARVMLALVLALGIALSFRTFLASIDAANTTELIDYSNNLAHSWGGAGGSGQVIETEFNGITDFIRFWPLGIFTALLRPLPGEFFTVFPFLASLENGLLLFLLIRAIVRFRLGDARNPIVIWAAAFTFFWAAIYSIASYQNLGSSVRFRLQILPIFLGLLLYLGRKPGTQWDDTGDEREEDEAIEEESADGDHGYDVGAAVSAGREARSAR